MGQDDMLRLMCWAWGMPPLNALEREDRQGEAGKKDNCRQSKA